MAETYDGTRNVFDFKTDQMPFPTDRAWMITTPTYVGWIRDYNDDITGFDPRLNRDYPDDIHYSGNAYYVTGSYWCQMHQCTAREWTEADGPIPDMLAATAAAPNADSAETGSAAADEPDKPAST